MVSCATNEKTKPTDNFDKAAVELNNQAVNLMILYPDSALAILDKATQLDKSYYMAYSNKAQIHKMRHDYSRAINETQNVIKAKPDMAEAMLMLGTLYDITGQVGKAQNEYQKAIEILSEKIKNDGKDETLYRSSKELNLAMGLIFAGRQDEGQELIEKLISKNPQEDSYQFFKGKDKETLLKEIYEK